MDESKNRNPILEMRGISKRFGAVQALSEVDFEVYLGEVVALVGDNGAGKSTLVKTISGVYQPDAGQRFFHLDPGIARRADWASKRFIRIWLYATISMWWPTSIWAGRKNSGPSYVY